jgi:phage terminase large subunit-like protein
LTSSIQPILQLWQTLSDAPRTVLELEVQRKLSTNKLAFYAPYPRQIEFHVAGAAHRERLLMAANQVGKTIAGSMEVAMHATGLYPTWWEGRRFEGPTIGWAAGVTGESTRDNVQRLLLGRAPDWGTGSIPEALLVDRPSPSRGVADLVDTILVRHISGAISQIGLKSYEKGREKWQGETLHYVWFDEEPPADIYIEGLTRIAATGGCVWMTFTPLLGVSDVVKRYLIDKSPDRHVTTMRIEEAAHYTEEQRAQIIAGYPEHEREARAHGIPVMGSGRVFPVTEDLLREPALMIPEIWTRIAGLDIGWDHPTAVAWLAHDRDTDTIHVTDCYRLREETPVVHAAAIKARGAWIPVAWPHDALQKDKGSGSQIAQQYRDQGVAMCLERATFDDGSSGVEAGIFELLDRMKTGRFKVAAHLADWWEEFRLYHRKDGVIVKEGDDLMSATRYALMAIRYARTKPKPKPMVHAYGGGSWMGS